MKNFNLLRFAASFTLFVLLFSSCSEDALKQENELAEEQEGKNEGTNNDDDNDDDDELQIGRAHV